MKVDVFTTAGLLLINLAILAYEKGFEHFSWQHYTAFGVLLFLGALFPFLVFVLLIPVTGYNLFINTTKLQGRYLD